MSLLRHGAVLLCCMCTARVSPTTEPPQAQAAEPATPAGLPDLLKPCEGRQERRFSLCVSGAIAEAAIDDPKTLNLDLCETPGVDVNICLSDVGYAFAMHAEQQTTPSIELLRARIELGARALRAGTELECRWIARQDLARFVGQAVEIQPDLRETFARELSDVVGGVPAFRQAVGLLDSATHRGLRPFLVAATFYRVVDRTRGLSEASYLRLNDDGTYQARLRSLDDDPDPSTATWSTETGTWELPEPIAGRPPQLIIDGIPTTLSNDYTSLNPSPPPPGAPSEMLGHAAWDLREHGGDVECPPAF